MPPVDVDATFLDSDAHHVRYASACASAFRNGSKTGTSRWYMPDLWHSMYLWRRKNSAMSF